MYLEQLIHTAFGYVRSFFSVLFKSSLGLFGPQPGTKPQIARFYFVDFVITALAIYYLLVDTGFYDSYTGINHPAAPGEICEPTKGLGIWTAFVLAEVASATIFCGAALGAWIIQRFAFQQIPPPGSIGHLASRLHRLQAPWFSLALIASVFTITPRVRAAVTACHQAHTVTPCQYSLQLLRAALSPTFIILTLVIATVHVFLFTRRNAIPQTYNRSLVVVVYLLTMLGSYSLALGLVGPSDLFDIVKLLRYVADPKKLV